VKDKPSVLAIKLVQDATNMLKTNEELIKLKQQLQQFIMANKEIERLQKDIKNKKITKVLVPTLGGNFIQVNPNSKQYKEMLAEKSRQFNNSIKGIEGQIEHREDYLHENMLRAFSAIGKHLKEHGLELPDLSKYEVK